MDKLQITTISLLFLFLIFLFWVWLSVVYWTLKNGISPMPTSFKTKRRVLASIPRVQPGKVIDLGSGWGNMTMAMAKLLPHCEVIGYENSPLPYCFSKIWNLFEKQKNLKYFRKNFFDLTFTDASVVYCYLYPGAMEKLAKKFNEELKPGTVVISNTFALPGWEALEIIEMVETYHFKIYIYVKTNNPVDVLQAKPNNQGESDDRIEEDIGISRSTECKF